MRLTRIIHHTARLYWKITRPITVGVRILLIEKDNILLVKHTYQDHWYLPGGGVKKKETIFDAINREIEEEIGGIIYELRLFNVYSNYYEGKSDHIVLFHSDNFKYEVNAIKNMEIEQIRLFPLNSLPVNISPGSKRRIEEYHGKKVIPGKEW